ncbi:AraC family transcriptional regulator [Liquorilactobacillus vini]|uniref:Transcription regulator n=1 Tax=Liquorilactobacillus vini DSM 20605 TaxID=1133569 RepID=A0A0R2CC19_9LACO|nr:AraC family transcriptional regulator [Liquorilactobacillus vini]KRM88658.1 transcription regulator [Liquorilactobacillus vini DSM 20605]
MDNRKLLHEIVIPTKPLSAWFYLHNEKETNTYIAPHWHQGIELSFTVSGSIDDFIINEQHFRTKVGTILVVNSQVIHSVFSKLKLNNQAISIIFPYSYVNRLYPEINKELININQPSKFDRLKKEMYVELQAILFKIYQNLQVTDKFKNLRLEALSDQVLQILVEYFTQPQAENKLFSGTKEFEITRIQEITEFVSENYQNKISLAEIAAQVNVSKQYLAKFFKQHLELTVGQYINNFRAQKAYYDLLGHTGNLTQIAQKNGFSTIRAMNQAFTKLYGKSASEFYRVQKRD